MDKNIMSKIGKRILFAVETLILWCLSLFVLLWHEDAKRGVTVSLLLEDIRNKFCDDSFFPQQMKRKIILLTIFFILILLVGLFTRFFERKIWYHAMLILLIVGTVVAYFKSLPIDAFSNKKWAGDLLIAHAGGGIDGKAYTNSKEALERNYELGHRTFELDFAETADGQIVCWHTWEEAINSGISENTVPTEEYFLAQKIDDKYTAISLEDVFSFMREHDDIYLITDAKDKQLELINRIVSAAEKTGSEELLDRLVVQLYNCEMYDAVEEVHHFPNYILTLYLLGGFTEDEFICYCRFCKEHDIRIITLRDRWVSPEIVEIADRYHLDIYVHTVNDVDIINKKHAFGVDGFYTDFVSPDMIY